MSPRCGKLMTPYETGQSGPVLEAPPCGRPAGHTGRCRSRAAVARYYAKDGRRRTAWRSERRAAARAVPETAIKPAPWDGIYAPVTPEQAARNRQVLGDALREHDEAVRASRRSERLRVWLALPAALASDGPAADLEARSLIRAYAEDDFAAVKEILNAPRTNAGWRQLAAVLASAADPGRLAAPGAANPGRRAA